MNKYKDLIESLGFSFKKQMLIGLLINLFFIAIGVLLFLYLKIPTYALILIIIFWLATDYLFYFRFYSLKSRQIRERNNEFVNILTYFDIFIHNRFTVYNALKSLTPYCSIWAKENIERLLFDIDSDKSIEPFIKFSKNYDSIVIQNVMISIYQMVDLGNSELSINEFSYLFKEMNSSYQKQMIDSKDKSFDIVNALPLFGAGFITIILTFGIISLIGEMINVV